MGNSKGNNTFVNSENTTRQLCPDASNPSRTVGNTEAVDMHIEGSQKR